MMERGGRPVAFLHLRKGLAAEAISWLGPDGKPAQQPTTERQPLETFGVPEPVQEALSHIRTDLDTFTEVEAYSLMADAYLMSAAELPRLGDLARPPAPGPQPWTFLGVEPWLRNPTRRYLRRLRVAQYRHFKLFRLKWPLALLALVAVLGLLGWLAWRTVTWTGIKDWLATPVPVGGVLLGLGVFGLVLIPQLFNLARLPSPLRIPLEIGTRLVIRLVLAPFVSAVSAIHLWVVDPLFRREGRLDRLGPAPPAIEP
jgi:NTE family protein